MKLDDWQSMTVRIKITLIKSQRNMKRIEYQHPAQNP